MGRAARAVALVLMLALGLQVVPGVPLLPDAVGEEGGSPAASGLSVRAGRGGLSLSAEEAPLGAVLEAVRQETGVAVRSHAPLFKAVSDRFRSLPLEAAFRRLLRSFDVVFVYAPATGRGTNARLTEVVVYPGSGAKALAAAPATPAAPRAVPGAAPGARPAASSPPDGVPAQPAARLTALEAAAGRGASESVRRAAAREIEAFLADRDVAVRKRALEVAETTGLGSAEALAGAALHDADQQVRWAALTALVATQGRESAIAAVRDGLASPTPAVRLAALEALGEQLGGDVAEASVRAALADPDPAVRAKAAEITAIFDEARELSPDADHEVDEPEHATPGQSG
jgi:hypothetical protein